MSIEREAVMAVPPPRGRSVPQSQSLLEVLSEYQKLLIVTHDNPDPDAIAAGWAVHHLIKQALCRPVQLIGGGGIVRAENRHMADLLAPPLQLVTSIELPPGTATILVDCEAGGTNQLLTRQDLEPIAVIDHHSGNRKRIPVRFRDVRPDVVASVTIAGSYLREQRIEPGTNLATAMLFAMRTETRGEEFSFSSLDRSMLNWATERADPALLAEIESAPLDDEYYADLVLALQNTFAYGDAGLCLLPRATGAEIVGETADLIIRCRSIHRVLCAAVVGEDLYVSVRTESDHGDAVELTQLVLAGIGSGGGHPTRAGGKISDVARFSPDDSHWQSELRGRWLTACHANGHRERRLVARHEIINHLK